MQKKIAASLFIFMLSIFSSSSFAQAPTTPNPQNVKEQPLCNKPLIVAWTHYPPFQIEPIDWQKSKRPTGLEIDLLTAIGEQTGCTFIYQNIPFARQLFDLQNGIVDLIFSAQKDDTTENIAYFSTPYRNETIPLFVRKNELEKYRISTFEELKNSSYVFGVKRGFYYGPELTKSISTPWYNSHIEQNVRSTMNVKKLVFGRLDGLFLEPVVERELTKNSDYAALIAMHPFVLFQGPVQILFSKKNISPNLVSGFNTALEKLQKEGKIKELLQKYDAE